MALIPLLEKKSFAENAESGVLEDTTVYGGANPDRNEVATFITVYKLDRLGNDTEAVVSDYNPETATEYTYTISQDGWFQAWFVIIDNYNAGTTYNQYDVMYNPSNDTVYRSTSSTPFSGQSAPNPTYWEAISEPTLLIENEGETNESNNLIYQVFDFVATPNTRIYAGNAVVDAASDCCGDCDRSEEVLSYELFYVLLDGMVVAEDRGAYAQAEKHARKAQEEYFNS